MGRMRTALQANAQGAPETHWKSKEALETSHAFQDAYGAIPGPQWPAQGIGTERSMVIARAEAMES